MAGGGFDGCVGAPPAVDAAAAATVARRQDTTARSEDDEAAAARVNKRDRAVAQFDSSSDENGGDVSPRSPPSAKGGEHHHRTAAESHHNMTAIRRSVHHAVSDHLHVTPGMAASQRSSPGGPVHAVSTLKRLNEKPKPVAAYGPREQVYHSCRRLAEHPLFNGLITWAICVVGVLEGFEANRGSLEERDGYESNPDVEMWMKAASDVIFGLFVVEVLIKVAAENGSPKKYLKDLWNRFDFVIVVASLSEYIVPHINMNFLRLLRLMRVVRLLHSFPALRSVTTSLLLAFANVGYVILMIMIVNFIFACVGMLLFEKNDPMNFGSVPQSMMTIWRVETLDGWEEVMYINMFGCDRYGYTVLNNVDVNTSLTVYAPERHFLEGYIPFDNYPLACEAPRARGWIAASYFLVVVMLGAMVLPTVLIGVISIAFDDATRQIKDEKKEAMVVNRVMRLANAWVQTDQTSPGDGGNGSGGGGGALEREGAGGGGGAGRPRQGATFTTDEDVARLRDIFNAMSFDDKPDMSEEELMPFLEYLCAEFIDGIETSKLGAMYAVVDVDGDGSVSWPEFLWFVLFLKRMHLENRGVLAPIVKGGGRDGDALPTHAAVLKEWGPKVVGRAPDPGGTHLATSPSSRAVVVGRDGEEAEGGRSSRSGILYVKTRKVHAMFADAAGMLDTVVGGVTEATTPYVAGDVIMVGSRGGRYVVKSASFALRYDTRDHMLEPAEDAALAAEGFKLFRPLGIIWALQLTPEHVAESFPGGGFTGHWGKTAAVAPNDFLAVPYPHGGEIYVIPGPLFHTTYILHDIDARDAMPAFHETSPWEPTTTARALADRAGDWAETKERDDALLPLRPSVRALPSRSSDAGFLLSRASFGLRENPDGGDERGRSDYEELPPLDLDGLRQLGLSIADPRALRLRALDGGDAHSRQVYDTLCALASLGGGPNTVSDGLGNAASLEPQPAGRQIDICFERSEYPSMCG